jgi:hypothetical protein
MPTTFFIASPANDVLGGKANLAPVPAAVAPRRDRRIDCTAIVAPPARGQGGVRTRS